MTIHQGDSKRLRTIVTGATSGLGQQAARVLAGRGHSVGLAVRNVERGTVFAKELGPHCDVLPCDFASMASVRACAASVIASGRPVDVLLLNAGIYGQPFQLTSEGFETTFASNYLGHFLLVHRLLGAGAFSKGARVVLTFSSAVHSNPFAKADLEMLVRPDAKKFSKYQASPSTKVLLALMLIELTARAGDALTVVGVSPGAVQTRNVAETPALFRPLVRLLARPLEEGVEPLVWAATEPGLKSGQSFDRKHRPLELNKPSRDAALAKTVWTESERILGLSPSAT